MMDRLREELAESDRDERRAVIRKVRKLVAERMGPELSVKTVADQVYMHPVYLSKVFKAETGESLGDYIFRMRMERAAHLLRDTNKKSMRFRPNSVTRIRNISAKCSVNITA